MALTIVKEIKNVPASANNSDAVDIGEFSSTTYIVTGSGFSFAVQIDAGDGNWAPIMEPMEAPYAVVLQGPANRARIAISSYANGTPVAKVVGTRAMEGGGRIV